MATKKEITATLESIGLSDKEVSVYMALLQKDEGFTTMEASELAMIPRTTVYDICQSLAEKGLVHVSKKKNTTVFSVPSPHHLFAFVQRKENDLAYTKQKLKHIITDLDALRYPNLPSPGLRQFQGTEGIVTMWQEQLVQSRIENETFHVICNSSFLGAFQSHLQELSKQFREKNLSVKVLVQSEEEDPIFLKIRNFEVKSMKENFVLAAGMDMMGDFIGYWTEIDELSGMQMENQQIAKLQASMFKRVWEGIT